MTRRWTQVLERLEKLKKHVGALLPDARGEIAAADLDELEDLVDDLLLANEQEHSDDDDDGDGDEDDDDDEGDD